MVGIVSRLSGSTAVISTTPHCTEVAGMVKAEAWKVTERDGGGSEQGLIQDFQAGLVAIVKREKANNFFREKLYLNEGKIETE